MRSVNVADLKNNLSRYLRQVRRGEEIVVRDRSLPIAKIVPLTGAEELDAETLELVGSGQLRLEQRPLDLEAFFSLPAPRRSRKSAVEALIADREERDASLLGR